MRAVIVLALAVILGLFTARQAISGEVTAKLQGKTYQGWVDDRGVIVIVNKYGKTVMNGNVNRVGGAEIIDPINNDSFVGRINPGGRGVLISPKSGDNLRIDLER